MKLPKEGPKGTTAAKPGAATARLGTTLSKVAAVYLVEVGAWALLLLLVGIALRVGFGVTFPFVSVLILMVVSFIAFGAVIRFTSKHWNRHVKTSTVVVVNGEEETSPGGEFDSFAAMIAALEAIPEGSSAKRGPAPKATPYL